MVGVVGVAIRVAGGVVVRVASGIAVGVTDGTAVGVTDGTAVGVVGGISRVASGGARDIVSLFKVKLSQSYRAIVIISLILIRAKLISSSVYLWKFSLLIISASTLLRGNLLFYLIIYTPLLTR